MQLASETDFPHEGVIDYIDVKGRTKIVVRNHISDYIPNPTFEVVARPGAQEEYFRHGSGGKSYREVMGKPMKAIPAFRNPEARLEVLDGLLAALHPATLPAWKAQARASAAAYDLGTRAAALEDVYRGVIVRKSRQRPVS